MLSFFPLSIRNGALLATAALVLSAPRLPAQSRFDWLFDHDAALRAAEERGVPMLVSVRIAGARGLEALENDLDKDARLAELAGHTVNLMITLATGADDPRPPETWLRGVLGVESKEATPQALNHIFFRVGGPAAGEGTAGDGAADDRGQGEGSAPEVLTAASGPLTAGQLEWLWADALRRVDDQFEWRPSDRTRAPLTFQVGEADGVGLPRPPRPDQVEAALDELKSGRMNWRRTFDVYRTLLQSDDPKALRYGRSEMRRHNEGTRRMALSTVAAISPEPWWEFAVEDLGDREPALRTEAAKALQSLAVPDSLRALRTQMRKEKELEPRGRLLRAMAVTGPQDRNVAKEIEKWLTRSRDLEVRVQAALSIYDLEDDALVEKLLRATLADQEVDVRKAGACVIGMRRERELLPLLDDIKSSGNLELEDLATAARKCTEEGAGLAGIREFLYHVGGDADQRRAAQRALGERGGRGGGDAGGGPDADGRPGGGGGGDAGGEGAGGGDAGGRRGGGRRGGGE